MIPNATFTYLSATLLISTALIIVPSMVNGDRTVKMCLFYDRPSGHARSDPIIRQDCAADHVHTFYGPRSIHPQLSWTDLVRTNPQFSTSPWNENQSLYWHPSIYQVQTHSDDNTKTYTRVSNLYTSPYYRWDTTVQPKVEAFPKNFRMIAANTDKGANRGGEVGSNLFTECCNLPDGDEDCQEWGGLYFPKKKCEFLGIAFNMPTCWNGSELGDKNDHKDHMAYTVDGTVAGDCPSGYNHRLPQVQVFVRIMNYKGDQYDYQLSDGNTDEWHVDFFGGWKAGVLEKIIQKCEPEEDGDTGFNPPCGCADDFLTPNEKVAKTMCDADVKRLIIDEEIEKTKMLPRGTCTGNLKKKWWNKIHKKMFKCKGKGKCMEYPKDKFFLNEDGGKKNCNWLKKKRTKNQIRNICNRENGTGGFDARIVCPVTCKACD